MEMPGNLGEDRPVAPRPTLCILGNSVGLKIRPPRGADGQGTYGEHLRRLGWDVCNFSRAGVEIGDAFAWYDDEVLGRFPQAVVFNFGVVEVSRRRIPRLLWYRSTAHNMFLNRIAGRPHPGSRLAARVRRWPWVALARIVEGLAGLVRISWSWTSPERLAAIQVEMLELLFKETSATAVVLGLNPCSDRVEGRLPGTRRSIVEANRRLREAVARFPRAAFLDPAEHAGEMGLDRFVPDGVHFSAEGHRIIAGALHASLGTLGSATGNP